MEDQSRHKTQPTARSFSQTLTNSPFLAEPAKSRSVGRLTHLPLMVSSCSPGPGRPRTTHTPRQPPPALPGRHLHPRGLSLPHSGGGPSATSRHRPLQASGGLPAPSAPHRRHPAHSSSRTAPDGTPRGPRTRRQPDGGGSPPPVPARCRRGPAHPYGCAPRWRRKGEPRALPAGIRSAKVPTGGRPQ